MTIQAPGIFLILFLTAWGTPTLATPSCTESITARPDLRVFQSSELSGGTLTTVEDPVGNDSSVCGAPLVLQSIAPHLPAGATASIFDGWLKVSLPAGFLQASVDYVVAGAGGVSASSTIHFVEHDELISQLQARPDLFQATQNTITELNVLGNDELTSAVVLRRPAGSSTPACDGVSTWTSSPNGIRLCVRSNAAGGAVIVFDATSNPGYWTPPAGALETFTYEIAEATAATQSASTSQAQVAVRVQPSAGRAFFLTHVYGPDFSFRDAVGTVYPQLQNRAFISFTEFPDASTWDFGYPGSPTTPSGGNVRVYDVNGHLWGSGNAAFHDFPGPGLYSVRARRGEDTGVVDIEIRNQPPSFTFAEPFFSCEGLFCRFQLANLFDDGPISSVSVDFFLSDGTPVTEEPPPGPPAAFAFVPRLGEFELIVRARDAYGGTTSASRRFTVADLPPTPNFQWSCFDLTCTFESTAHDDFPPLASSTWLLFPSGATNALELGQGQSLTWTFDRTGDHAVALRITDSGGQNITSLPRHVRVTGALVAEPDWVALPEGIGAVTFQPLANDRTAAPPLIGFDWDYDLLEAILFKDPAGNWTYQGPSGPQFPGLERHGVVRLPYTVSDSSGAVAAGVSSIVMSPVASVFRVDGLSEALKTIPLGNVFSVEPLVFLGPLGRNEDTSAVARIVSLSNTAVNLRVQEFGSGADATHAGESLTLIAVVPEWSPASTPDFKLGSGTLNQQPFVAGLVSFEASIGVGAVTDSESPAVHIAFPAGTFAANAKPLVFAQLQTSNSPGVLLPRLGNVTSAGFNLSLVRLDSPPVAVEKIAWIAFAPFGGEIGGQTLEADWSATGLAQGSISPALDEPFGRPPLLLATTVVDEGVDPWVIRQNTIQPWRVDLYAQALATSSRGSRLGLLAFEYPSLISGQGGSGGRPPVPSSWLAPTDDFDILADETLTLQPGRNDFATHLPLAFSLASGPQFGEVVISGDSVTYKQTMTPPAGIVKDQFEIWTQDTLGRLGRSKVTVWLPQGGEK